MLYRDTFLLLVILAGLLAGPISANAQADKAERKPGEVVEVEIAKDVKMKFCWIPPGEAQLGSPKAERDEVLKLILPAESEEARGKYKTKGFWLGMYPVTQKEWSAVMGKNPSWFVPTREVVKKAVITDTSRFPVEEVSWDDCDKLIDKLNVSVKAPAALGKGKFRLPHENEWEYAARGGKGNKQPFYFGNELNGMQANCRGTEPYGTETKGPFLGRTTEVGKYEEAAPHPWGLCDMAGNVGQWCKNKYDDKEEGFLSRDHYVLRGGGCLLDPKDCRSAHRGYLSADYRRNYIGCRVCFRLDD